RPEASQRRNHAGPDVARVYVHASGFVAVDDVAQPRNRLLVSQFVAENDLFALQTAPIGDREPVSAARGRVHADDKRPDTLDSMPFTRPKHVEGRNIRLVAGRGGPCVMDGGRILATEQ